MHVYTIKQTELPLIYGPSVCDTVTSYVRFCYDKCYPVENCSFTLARCLPLSLNAHVGRKSIILD